MYNTEQIPGKEPSKLWNRSYILVLLLSTFNNSASQMVQPFVAKYAISLGAPLTIAATIASIMSIAALLFRPVSGLCSDRFNRKYIIICTSTITAICMYFYAVAKSVIFLVAVRLIHGVVFSFSGVALMAYNTSFIPKDRLGEGMGWMALSSIVSSSLGPNLGLWLVQNVSYKACFLAAGCACLLTTGIVLLMRYDYKPLPPEARRRLDINSLISLRILPFALLMGLFSCGNGLVNTFLTLLGDERNIPNVAIFFTVYSAVMVACRPFAGKLQDKKGVKMILYPAYAIMAISMLILGRAASVAAIVVAGALKALGQGCGAPAIQAHCLKTLGKEKAGVVSSTCYIGQDIGNAVAPTVGGLLVSAHGYEFMFTAYAALLLVLGWGLFYGKMKYDEKKYGPETA